MVTIFYFSGSGHSLAVAQAMAEFLGCGLKPIGGETEAIAADTAVVAFPVYCQNIPQPVVDFLKLLNAKYVALLATYGRISYGRVLYEAQKLVQELQSFITDNCYTCTREILAGLGQMYVQDPRFQKNIDRHGAGTAAFISEAIAAYCQA